MTDNVYVSVTEGKIQGIKKISKFSSTEYYSFLGVPYAQPPVGQARFKDPVKIKPWKHLLKATNEKGGCRQFSLLSRKLSGSEDCLYNNIHTLRLPKKDDPPKPVIVNIHPGAFIHGTADPSIFGSPDLVIHHDIVYVCISFRLHILGFLNLGLKECSGNQALKDVIMGLEWIKENICSFGGDPNNITLIGSSTGAAIIHALMLSPLSNVTGLFHKAVLMGMYLMNPTLVTYHQNMTVAFEMAKSLGYNGKAEDKRKLLSFYKKIPIDALILLKPLSHIPKDKIPVFPASPFLPTSDPGENSVLPLKCNELASTTARIPIMIGFCEQEAVLGLVNSVKSKLEKNLYSTITQNIWGWGQELTINQLKQIEEQAEQFYLKGEPTNIATLTDKGKILTDIALSDVYDSLINVITKDLPSSVYVYRFDYEGSIPTIKGKIMAQMDEPLKGTVHGDDYSYWAFIKDHWLTQEYHINQKTREMIKKFTKLVCTFAEKGNPNYEGLEVQWNPSTIEKPHYLIINDPLISTKGKLNGKRMEFWENMKRKFVKH